MTDVRDKDVPELMKIALYRIIQEAMYKGNSISLTVEDNDTGFDLEEALSRGRMGLIGMEERA